MFQPAVRMANLKGISHGIELVPKPVSSPGFTSAVHKHREYPSRPLPVGELIKQNT